MKAVILAGGLGTRIRAAIGEELPKPMAPVGDRPFLAFLLDYLLKYRIRDVVLSVGYRFEAIRDYFGSGHGDQNLYYAVEEQPLGTGGGLRRALQMFSGAEDVLVLNGDTYFPADIDVFFRQHQQARAEISLALKPLEQNKRYGRVTLAEDGRVASFGPPREGPGLINSGLYLFKPEVFDRFALPERFSLEAFLEEQVRQLQLFGFPTDAYFMDIGIPEDYARFQQYMGLK